jgi:hypothetical protein
VLSTDLRRRTLLRVTSLETEAFEGQLRIKDESLRNQVLKIVQHGYVDARINPDNLEYYPFDTFVLAGAFVNPCMPDEFKPVVTVALKRARDLRALDERLEVDPLKLVGESPLDLVYPVGVAGRAAVAQGAGGVYSAMRLPMLELLWKHGFQAQAGLNATKNSIASKMKRFGYDVYPVTPDNAGRTIFSGPNVVTWLPRKRFQVAGRRLWKDIRQGYVMPFVWDEKTRRELALLDAPPFI